jgi:heavy metal translocating P-type ATPase
MKPANCYLCGLPLRYGAVSHTIDGRTLHFCCQGCRMVYSMLLESADAGDPAAFKETDLYRQCVAAGVIPADENDLERIHAQNRRPAAGTPAAPQVAENDADGSNTLPLNLIVDGMWCTACAWVIEKSLSNLPGVQRAVCHFSTDRLRCRYRPDRIAPDQIRAAVTRLGYRIREGGASRGSLFDRHREMIRLIVTGLLSANVMMLSWALYAGFFTDLSDDAVAKISLPIGIMAVAAFVYGGGPMLRKAWHGLVNGAPGMETLVGMGAGCALVYSLYNWFSGSIHLYFDTACMLITLVLLGKFLEQQAKDRVRRDLDAFFALQPSKVRIITDGCPSGRYVSIDQLAIGDRFVVENDEIAPADGRVESGTASLDESSLTGEPRPVAVKAGDPLKSGTRVIEGRVTVRAEKVGADTILGRMITIMSRSLEQKTAFEGRTDRMLRWFVPVILALALATGLACLFLGSGLNQAVVRTVTVMVISCPCALGVAIPMARLAGISLAGRRGLLVRDMEAFERADQVDAVVFDKTGTLTHGRWRIRDIRCRSGYDPVSVLALVAGLEESSNHPIARAIRSHARTRGIVPLQASDVQVSARGISGRFEDGMARVGTRQFAWEQDTPDRPAWARPRTEPTSLVFVGVDGQPAATLAFGDTIRAGVCPMIQKLKARCHSLHLISGDGRAATLEVARSIGLGEAHGSLMPDEKAAYVEALTQQGRRVAMVGDGINDAPAMARAHLAVAVHSGRGLAKEAAHITLMRGDPSQLLDFFTLAHRVNRKVVQNLWCAWIYNLIGIPVAMSGLLNPLVAATAMMLSSLTVIGNTLLLLRRNA